MEMRTEGAWDVLSQTVKNSLEQAAFNMIGDLFVTGSGPRPSAIVIADADGIVMSTRLASFGYAPASPGPGVIITGTATFSAADAPRPIAFLGLLDSTGDLLAEAELDAQIPAGQSIVVTRTDTFMEA